MLGVLEEMEAGVVRKQDSAPKQEFLQASEFL